MWTKHSSLGRGPRVGCTEPLVEIIAAGLKNQLTVCRRQSRVLSVSITPDAKECFEFFLVSVAQREFCHADHYIAACR
jgi:hypothetical protein